MRKALLLSAVLLCSCRMQSPSEAVQNPDGTYTVTIYSLPSKEPFSFIPKAYADSSTFNPDANPETSSVDGFVRNNGDDYATVHDATTGNSSNDSGGTFEVENANEPNYYVKRGIVCFPTASLPDGATITAATFSIYAQVKFTAESDSHRIVTATPASNTALSTADYNKTNFGTTALASDKTTSSISTSAYNDFAFNSTGLATISTTATTCYGVRSVEDVNGTTPSGTNSNLILYYSADNGSNVPKFVVTYSAAAATATAPTSLPLMFE